MVFVFTNTSKGCNKIEEEDVSTGQTGSTKDNSFRKLCHLIVSEDLAKLSMESALVYLTLRADSCISETATSKSMRAKEKIVSSHTEISLAKHFNKPLPTISRCIKDLKFKGLIKEDTENFLFILGEVVDKTVVWHFDKVKELKRQKTLSADAETQSKRKAILDLVREHTQRAKEARIAENKKKAKGIVPKSVAKAIIQNNVVEFKERRLTSGREFWKIYKEKFKKKFCTEPPLAVRLPDNPLLVTQEQKIKAYGKTNALCTRYLKFCYDDLTTAKSMLDWVFDNWNELSYALNMSGYPTINVFGTQNVVERFFVWQEHGIPQKRALSPNLLGRRGDEERHTSKDIGKPLL